MCRKEIKKGKAAGSQKRSSAGKKRKGEGSSSKSGGSGKDKKEGRGPVKDRTCHNCKRVFTSQLGLKYHVGKSTGTFSV